MSGVPVSVPSKKDGVVVAFPGPTEGRVTDPAARRAFFAELARRRARAKWWADMSAALYRKEDSRAVTPPSS